MADVCIVVFRSRGRWEGNGGGRKKKSVIYFHLFESRLIFADKIFKGLEIRN